MEGMAEARYEPLLKLAAGGMATVFVGSARGSMGFRQLVALKRPHPHLLADPLARKELVAEARLAALIHHANVVDVRDVDGEGDELMLVMDYIEGGSLSELLSAGARAENPVPPGVVVLIVLDAAAGLQAAHELVDERGRPVGLIHRDVSPQNLLVGIDGTTRVSDFGVAKLTSGASTSQGTLKGKLAYMAPEYLKNERIDRRLDVFALGVVLWEGLAGARLFKGAHDADTLRKVLEHAPEPISARRPALGTALDSVVATALAKSPDERFQTAAAFATALEATARTHHLLASHADVAECVKALVGSVIEARRVEIRKKLASEPSVLSLFKTDAPPEVANLPPSSDLAVTVGPPTKPNAVTLPIDAPPPKAPMPVSTLPLARPAATVVAVPASAPPSTPHVEEPSRPYDPMEISQLPSPPKRSLALPLAVAALVVVGAAVGLWTLSARSVNHDTTETATTSVPASTPPPPPTEPPSVTASSSPPLASLKTHPVGVPSSSGKHVSPTASSTPPAPSSAPRPTSTDDPPPNPY